MTIQRKTNNVHNQRMTTNSNEQAKKKKKEHTHKIKNVSTESALLPLYLINLALPPPLTLIKLIQLFPMIHIQSMFVRIYCIQCQESEVVCSFSASQTHGRSKILYEKRIYACMNECETRYKNVSQRLICSRQRPKKGQNNTNCDDFICISVLLYVGCVGYVSQRWLL